MSTTTPLPITGTTPSVRIPDGSRCRAYFWSPTTNRVAGVVAAIELHDVVDAVSEEVSGLALALVAPLGANNHDGWHGGPLPETVGITPQSIGRCLHGGGEAHRPTSSSAAVTAAGTHGAPPEPVAASCGSTGATGNGTPTYTARSQARLSATPPAGPAREGVGHAEDAREVRVLNSEGDREATAVRGVGKEVDLLVGLNLDLALALIGPVESGQGKRTGSALLDGDGVRVRSGRPRDLRGGPQSRPRTYRFVCPAHWRTRWRRRSPRARALWASA